MKRAHRKTHLAIWFMVPGLLALLVWLALAGRVSVETVDKLPLIGAGETLP